MGLGFNNIARAMADGFERADAGREQKRMLAHAAEQFRELGPEGAEMATFMEEDPKAAIRYMKEFGGTGAVYKLFRGRHENNRFADTLEQLGDEGYTPQERRDAKIGGLRVGINPSQTGSIVDTPDLPPVLRSLLSQGSIYTADSIAEAGSEWESSEDQAKAIGKLRPRDKKGSAPWASGTPTEEKWRILRDQRAAVVSKAGGDPRSDEQWIQADKQYKDGSAGGGLTTAQKTEKREIQANRKIVMDEIRNQGTTLRDALGVFDIWTGTFSNPKDPALAKAWVKARNSFAGEDPGGFNNWMSMVSEWESKGTPRSDARAQPPPPSAAPAAAPPARPSDTGEMHGPPAPPASTRRRDDEADAFFNRRKAVRRR